MAGVETLEAEATPSVTSAPTGLAAWFHGRGWRQVIISVPFLWLFLFFFIPFVIVVAMSVAVRTETSPPFSFIGTAPFINTENFARLADDSLYVRAFFTSLWNAAISTGLCLLIGYPMALALTRVSKAWRNILLMLIVLPFWTSFLLRVYAWIGLMGANSWLNRLLTGLYNMLSPDAPLHHIQMMNTNFAVILVTVYCYLPFMVLPLYANLEKLDLTLNEAAMDLGSRPWQVFRDVTLPLSIPGIIAGGLLVFIPASGELVIPSLVGSASDPMIGRVISDEFASARDWPMAATVAVALLVLLVGPTMLYNHFEARAQAAAEPKP
jgi:putrescine transport system permease protein